MGRLPLRRERQPRRQEEAAGKLPPTCRWREQQRERGEERQKSEAQKGKFHKLGWALGSPSPTPTLPKCCDAHENETLL